jgi:Ca2+-binding RTX toxin-like protein
MRLFESLETRRMMSVTVMQQGSWLWINGSSGNDHITVEDAGSTGLRVRDNGVSLGAKYGVNNVILYAGGAADRVLITSGKTHVLFQIDLGGGNDWVEPGYGHHFITGGSGIDSVSYKKFGIPMWITNKDGNWTGYRTSSGVTHEDKLAADVEGMYGSSGDDVLIGNNYANQLYGEGGDDIMFGYAGDDYLSGGYGDDSMWGHEGNDTLHGHFGNDSMLGGKGSDTFWASDYGDVDTVIGDDLAGVNIAGTFDKVYGGYEDLLSGHEWASLT